MKNNILKKLVPIMITLTMAVTLLPIFSSATLLAAGDAPAASGVQISGTATYGQTLTGSYIYSDAEGDPERLTTFKWYRADDAFGTNKTEIIGATSATYTLQSADTGKYISFEVTPAAQTGTSPGAPAESAFTQKVTVPFYVGNALHFSDADDRLYVNSPLTTQTNNITMETWVKADTITGAETAIRIMYNGNSGNSGYGIYLVGPSKAVALLFGGIYFVGPTTPVTLTTGQWYHLAAVRDNGAWKLYVNGELQPMTYSTQPNIPTQQFSVGNSYYNNENFTGCIDETRFWTVARTQQQIKDSMYVKLDGNEPGLLAYYKYDQGIANGDNTAIDTVTNSVTSGTNLTLSGFTRNGTVSNFVQSVQIGTFQLEKVAYETNENESAASVTIIRTGGSEGSAIINYATQNGTATAGTHYTGTTGSVTFAGGETVKTISIPIIENHTGSNLDFTLSVSAIQGVVLGTNKSAVIQITPNTSPAVTGVQISGTAAYGHTLTGSYTYSDAENDSEGMTKFKWYRADDALGTNKTEITGATAATYTLQSADTGKYISFEVTPAAQEGNTPGTAALSSYTAKVQKAMPSISAAPTASAITYGQTLANSALTGGSASTAGTFSWTAPSTAPAVSDSGVTEYFVTFTPADSSNYTAASTMVKLTVNKAITSISTAPTASAITYGQTLANSALTGGSASTAGTFSWTTPSTAPAVSDSGVTEYFVTFTPADSSNYTAASTTVKLTVNKAITSISAAPTASAITYGQTLANSALTGGSASTAGTFSWTTPSTAPAVSDSGVTEYFVTFTPADSSNYTAASTTVKLTVNKAITSISAAPTASAITYGQTLANSALTGGSASTAGTFSWTTPSTAPAVSDSGVTEYFVTFTPADSSNYTAASTTVKLTVNKAITSISAAPTASAITYGQTLANSALTGGSASTAGTFSWTAPSTAPAVSDSGVTEYFVTFTPADSSNYTAASTTVKLTVNKAITSISTAPTASAITYGQTLANSALTGGSASTAGTFSWTTPSTAPAVSDSGVTEYFVTFTPADSSNYTAASTTVKLIVNKANAGAPAAPVLSYKTQTKVVLKAVSGYEYAIAANGADIWGGSWQDSNVFRGLSANTAYDFYQRIKETATHNPSVTSSKLDVTTDAPVLTGTAIETPAQTIEGNLRTIKGTLLDSNDNPMTGYVVELHSDPMTTVTDANGRYAFYNVDYTNHELIVKTSEGVKIAEFALAFFEGENFNADVKEKGVNITYNRSTETVYIVVKLITDQSSAVISQVSDSYQQPISDSHGGISPVILWIVGGIAAAAIIVLLIIIMLKKKKD